MNDNFCDVPAHHQSIESTPVAKINLGVNGKRCMDNLEAEIRGLVAKGDVAIRVERGRITNQLMDLLFSQRETVAGAKANHPGFGDAWAKTEDYFFANLWEVKTRKKGKLAFCKTDETIVFVLKAYLERRISDGEMEQKGFRRETVKSSDPNVKISQQWVKQKFLDAPIGKDDARTLGESLPAPQKNGNFKQLWELVEEDVTGELGAMTMKSQPDLSAQRALLMFLAGYKARDIAKHFGVSEQTFNSFFKGDKKGRDCCVKLLRRLWDEQYG